MSTSTATELLREQPPACPEAAVAAAPVELAAPPAAAARARPWWLALLLSASLLALVDQALVSGTNFVVGVLVARFAGIYEMGVYTLSYTLIVLAINAHYSLLAAPYTFFANQLAPRERRAMAGSMLVQHFVITLGLVLVLLLGSGLALACGAPAWLTTALVALSATIPFILLRELGRRCAFAELNVLTVVIIDGSATVLTLGSLFLLGRSQLLSGAGAVVVIGAASGLVGLVWFASAWRTFHFSRTQFRTDVHRFWEFGKWVFASQGASVTSAYITHWTLAALLDAAATGAFAACQNVAQLANPLLFGIANVLEPKASAAIARGGHRELRRVVNQMSRWLVGAVSVMALAFAFLGAWAVRLLYGSAEPDIPFLVMPMLALTMVCSALNVGLIHSLRAAQRSEVNVKADVLSVLVTLVILLAVLLADAKNSGLLVGTVAMLLGNVCGLALRYWGYRLVVHSAEVRS